MAGSLVRFVVNVATDGALVSVAVFGEAAAARLTGALDGDAPAKRQQLNRSTEGTYWNFDQVAV